MALTRHGNRTGRAASIELQDQRREIIEHQIEQNKKNNELAALALADARDDLIALDPGGWENWWDSDALPDVPYPEMIPFVLKRIDELRRAERVRTIFSVMKAR